MRTFVSALSAIALVSLGLVALSPTSPVAAIPSSGTLTVQLVSPGGAPVTSSGVYANATYQVADVPGAKSGVTNSQGRVTFTELPLLTPITVEVDLPIPSTFIPPSPVTVILANANTLAVQLPIAQAASARGVVKNSSGSPVKGTFVRAFDGGGTLVSEAVTSSKGKYRLIGLPTGTYRLQFSQRTTGNSLVTPSKYVTTYWKGASWSTADLLSVKQQTASASASARTDINATLRAGYKLTIKSLPTNTASITFFGDSDAEVFAVPVNFAPSATVRLPKGSYRILFNIAARPDNYTLWYSAPSTVSDQNFATPVSFAATSNKTITLVPPAPIDN